MSGKRGPWQELPFNNGQNYYEDNITTSCLRKGTVRVQVIDGGLLGLRLSGPRKSLRIEAHLSREEARILAQLLTVVKDL